MDDQAFKDCVLIAFEYSYKHDDWVYPLADALAGALTVDTADRVRLRAAGRRLSATCYNYDKTVRRFMDHIAPWGVISASGPGTAGGRAAVGRWGACSF